MTPRRITTSVPPQWIGNEYASVSPFNCDNTRLLVIDRDHFQLLDGSGAFIKDLGITASEEPRWSRTDPTALYYIRGNQVMFCRPATNNQDVIKRTFTEYTSISGKGEGDLSPNGTLALCGTRTDGGAEVFTFNVIGGTKGPVYPQAEPIDGLKIDSRNRIILSKASGIYVLEASGERKIFDTNGHAALGSDNGEDVLIVTSNQDNGIWLVRIVDGVKRLLLVLGWSLAVDISACDGFALVSTYGAEAAGKYANQILKVSFGGWAEVVCDTGSIAPDYTAQPKASLSRNGLRFVFSSNSGVQGACNVWLGELTAPAATETVIDSRTLADQEFILRPRADGAWDIIQRKVS